ncbi:MAG: alanine racemase [Alphaproteobacteria bacterium]
MSGHKGRLTIDLAALSDNYRMLSQKIGPSCEASAVVKANGYGLGVERIAPALYHAGARSFFVATVEEGEVLRNALPKGDIYILNGFSTHERKLYHQYQLSPVLNSLYDIEQYARFSSDMEKTLPALIHVDTGMNRLGLEQPEVEFIGRDPAILDGIDVQYVMSHFCSSEQPSNPSNRRQYDLFHRLCQKLEAGKTAFKKSICNSGGIFADDTYHLDLVRPGIALYGGNPSDEDVNPMSQLVSLDVPILQIKSVKSGDFCGYNETYRFDKNSRIAILSIGYADGVSRYLSNQGALYYKGYNLPIRGRVSMDLIICDLSGVAECDMPAIGDMVEVLGGHQTIDDLAQSAGTIPYEILTSLGDRYARLYRE